MVFTLLLLPLLAFVLGAQQNITVDSTAVLVQTPNVTTNATWSDIGADCTPETATVGAPLSLEFTGVAIYLLATACPTCGVLNVIVDDIGATSIDTYATSVTCYEIVFQNTGLSNMQHIITVTLMGPSPSNPTFATPFFAFAGFIYTTDNSTSTFPLSSTTATSSDSTISLPVPTNSVINSTNPVTNSTGPVPNPGSGSRKYGIVVIIGLLTITGVVINAHYKMYKHTTPSAFLKWVHKFVFVIPPFLLYAASGGQNNGPLQIVLTLEPADREWKAEKVAWRVFQLDSGDKEVTLSPVLTNYMGFGVPVYYQDADAIANRTYLKYTECFALAKPGFPLQLSPEGNGYIWRTLEWTHDVLRWLSCHLQALIENVPGYSPPYVLVENNLSDKSDIVIGSYHEDDESPKPARLQPFLKTTLDAKEHLLVRRDLILQAFVTKGFCDCGGDHSTAGMQIVDNVKKLHGTHLVKVGEVIGGKAPLPVIPLFDGDGILIRRGKTETLNWRTSCDDDGVVSISRL